MVPKAKKWTDAKRRWEVLLLPFAVLEIGIGLVTVGLGASVVPDRPADGLAVVATGALGIALPGILLLLRSRFRYRAHLPILLLLLGLWARSLFQP